MGALADTATDLAFGAAWGLAHRMPERSAYAAFAAAADTAWRRRGRDVSQLERNLARVHPQADAGDLRELSRAGMRSYSRYWCDAFRMPTWSPARVRDTYELRGVERLDAYLAAGTGVVITVNHAGNWDHAGAYAAQRYGALTTVVERLRPEGLYRRFVEFRRSRGIEVLPLGDPDVVRTLVRRLRAGRLVPLLGDRDLSGTGIEVDLFGETALLPAGPATLALMTGCPLIPGVSWYEDDRAVTELYPDVAVPTEGTTAQRARTMTQAVARVYEHGLVRHAVDWHMLQPVWRTDVLRADALRADVLRADALRADSLRADVPRAVPR